MHDSNDDGGVAANEDAISPDSRAFAEGDLGTIQNILFGSQAQQFEGRMSELESRIEANADILRAQIRSELRASQEAVRARLDGGMSELRDAIGVERQSRLEAIDDVQHAQRGRAKELAEGIAAVEHEARSSLAELNQRFEARANELSATSTAMQEQIDAAGAETRAQLNALASEREVLAEIFDKAAQALRSMDGRADEA